MRPKKKPTADNGVNVNWLKDWPMQSIGADILRLAIIKCLESGIQVCAPIHDAILIQAPIDQIDDHVRLTQDLMTQSSVQVIDFPIKTDAVVVKYPDHYVDKRGMKTWETLWGIIRDRRDRAGNVTPS
jgi:hypothetical protein